MPTPHNDQPEFTPFEPSELAEEQTTSYEVEETPAQETTAPVTQPAKVESSIAGSTWVALILGILLLILLLVFIMQNQESAELQLFAWTMNFPIGVGMLLAAIVGALVMACVGGIRIMQLRRQVARQSR